LENGNGLIFCNCSNNVVEKCRFATSSHPVRIVNGTGALSIGWVLTVVFGKIDA
jgi:hypothetical protein